MSTFHNIPLHSQTLSFVHFTPIKAPEGQLKWGVHSNYVLVSKVTKHSCLLPSVLLNQSQWGCVGHWSLRAARPCWGVADLTRCSTKQKTWLTLASHRQAHVCCFDPRNHYLIVITNLRSQGCQWSTPLLWMQGKNESEEIWTEVVKIRVDVQVVSFLKNTDLSQMSNYIHCRWNWK